MLESGKMVADLRFLMGGGRWAMEMWVGSHPSIHPCDLSTKPDIGYWLVKDRDTQMEFNYSLIPRIDRSMRDYVSHSEPKYDVTSVMDDEKHRYKDFNLLGGLLTRFRLMYAEMPSDTSWMWSLYPDGQAWKEGLKQYGQDNVYEKVAAQYFNPTNPPTQALVEASTISTYDPAKCQNMVNGHCQDQGGGAWSYRNEDGSCAHTESNAPRDQGAINSLHDIFPDVKSVMDFGGGLGPYLTAFRDHAERLVTVEPFDLEGCVFQGISHNQTDVVNTPLDRLPYKEFDLVMTIEVLEHIPVGFHAHVIVALTQATKQYLLFSAAHPGQDGEGHVGPSMKRREQWIEEITNFGKLQVHWEKTKAFWEGSGSLLKENSVIFELKEQRTE